MNPGSPDIPSHPAGKAVKPLESFDAPSIEQWISHLPLSDVNAACEAIHGLLRTLNTTDGVECLERQRIVEQIRQPAVSLVAMTSEQHLPKTTLFPLQEPQHRRTQQNIDICLELANAYRRVVTCGTFFSDKVMGEAMRAQTVYRALQAYGLALLRSVERYESPPDGFWQEVYAFYRFAEGHGLHTASLPAPEVEGATIDSQFKQMLLLSLSSYQHHLPDEIRQFYATLMLVARDAEIQTAAEKEDGEAAVFYFDIGTDNAPRPVKRTKKLKQGERRYLFTQAVLENIRQYVSSTAQQRGGERLRLRNEAILSLVEALSASEKRRFVRTPASGRRRFVVGLPRLVDELSGAAAELSQHGDISELHSEPPPPPPEMEVEEVEIVLGELEESGPDEIWVKSKSSAAFLSKPPAPAPAPARLELTGALLNSSAGGYCMSWLNPQFSGARIGELIGIYEDEQRIHLGVVRWLHHKAKGELVIGVELLSPRVEAVDVETGPDSETLQRGLYFSANPKLGHPDSLLCAPGALKADHDVAVRSKHGRLPFRLEKLLGSTLSFQLFRLVRPDGSDPA